MNKPWTLKRLADHWIVILGLGREGWSSYQFLRQHLPKTAIMLVDDLPISKLDQRWSKATANDPLVSVETTRSLSKLPTNAVIFKTPGLPPSHPVLKNNDQPVTSNTQLFFDLLETEETGLKSTQFTTIGITGTKGKSTTSSLIAHVLKMSGFPVVLGGNIGVPPLDLVPQLEKTKSPTYVVLELSAHQLADLQTSPHIAVVQNIVPEHLDYYASFEAYLAAKNQITRWQTKDDYVIYNPDSTTARSLAKLSPGHQIPFRIETFNEWLLFQDEPIIKLAEIPLVGEHNLQNVLPAIVIAKHLAVPTLKITKAIQTYTPLEHRLEFVAEVDGVSYYNDSLSTLPEATMAAIESFSQPVILMAGGHERHQDFSELAALIVAKSVKVVYLFATTGARLKSEIETYAKAHAGSKLPLLIEVSSMEDAVKQASKKAKTGDVVLMSPASPSFGEFKDYQDRGNQFKEAVQSLSS